MNNSWVLFALLSAAFAALVAIFGKIGVSKLDSTVATAVRAVIMAVFLVLVVLALGKASLVMSFDRRALLFVAAAGVAGALSWLCYFFALKIGPATGVAALDRLSVVFVVVFSLLFLGDSWSWKTAIGALILTFGAILMAWK